MPMDQVLREPESGTPPSHSFFFLGVWIRSGANPAGELDRAGVGDLPRGKLIPSTQAGGRRFSRPR